MELKNLKNLKPDAHKKGIGGAIGSLIPLLIKNYFDPDMPDEVLVGLAAVFAYIFSIIAPNK